MNARIAITGVALVVAASLAGTAFRVASSADLAKQRREAARATCMAAGGQWIVLGRDEACRPANPIKR